MSPRLQSAFHSTRVPPSSRRCVAGHAGARAAAAVTISPRITDSVNSFEPTTTDSDPAASLCAVATSSARNAQHDQSTIAAGASCASPQHVGDLALRGNEARDELIGRRAHQLAQRAALHDRCRRASAIRSIRRGSPPRRGRASPAAPSCAACGRCAGARAAARRGRSDRARRAARRAAAASGSSISARMRLTRWRWPPDSCAGCRVERDPVGRCTSASSSRDARVDPRSRPSPGGAPSASRSPTPSGAETARRPAARSPADVAARSRCAASMPAGRSRRAPIAATAALRKAAAPSTFRNRSDPRGRSCARPRSQTTAARSRTPEATATSRPRR